MKNKQSILVSLDPRVIKGLREVRERTGTSMSAYVNMSMIAQLQRDGIDINKEDKK